MKAQVHRLATVKVEKRPAATEQVIVPGQKLGITDETERLVGTVHLTSSGRVVITAGPSYVVQAVVGDGGIAIRLVRTYEET